MAKGKVIINVAIDPGFSGCKMVIGNDDFIDELPVIPFAILDITGQEEKYTSLSDKDIVWSKNGKTYLIGEKVKKALLTDTVMDQAKTDYENFTTNSSRFSTDMFAVALEGCFAWGLENYLLHCTEHGKASPFSSLDETSDVELRLGVALPHADINNFNENIYKYAECKHEFDVIINKEKKHANFTIKKNNSTVKSQTIMALLNETMDDYGNDIDDNAKDEFLPAVIIDAGYHTVGRALLTEALTIEKDGSDTKYAMANINESVSEELKKYNIIKSSATIDELYKRGTMLDGVVYDKDGKRREVDVDIVELKNDMIEQNVNLMMDEFCKIYNDFNGIRKIIIAGGSGKSYYEYIVAYFEKKGLLKAKSRCHLASGKINGHACEPVMAIACGLYKTMAAEV